MLSRVVYLCVCSLVCSCVLVLAIAAVALLLMMSAECAQLSCAFERVCSLACWPLSLRECASNSEPLIVRFVVPLAMLLIRVQCTKCDKWRHEL